MADDMTVENAPGELKMWLAVRTDLGLSPQKLAGQSGHAFGNLFLDVAALRPELMREYTGGREAGSEVDTGQAKIVVVAKNEAALLRVREEARLAGIPSLLVKDEGRTEIEPGTATVVAFGPARREDLPQYLKRLRKMEDRDTPGHAAKTDQPETA